MWKAILTSLLSTCLFAQPDLIVHNAKIVKVDPKFSFAQAMAIKGDRIVAIGTNAAILRQAAPGTQRVDMKGKTILPGLMDTHVHANGAAMYEFDHEVPEMETLADVLKYIKGRATVLPEGDWIRVAQVFVTRIREQRFPTRDELDKIAPKHPVYFSTGPDASLNSLALKLSGIDRNFKVTDGKPGRIEFDAKGEPNGIVRSFERFIAYKPTSRKPTTADKRERLKKLIADYNSVGITSITDRNTSDDELETFRQLYLSKELNARVFVTYAIDAQMPVDQIETKILKAAADPLHKYDNMLWLRGVKLFLDGGMLTGSAFMLEPWGLSKVYSIEDPDYKGMRYIAPEKLYQIARTALKNDFQITAHSVGDGAVTALVDAYERINEHDFVLREKRPAVTHSNFMTADAIKKMKNMGIVADLQPAWLWLDGATLLKQFGDKRLAYFQPYKTLFDSGVIVGGGSDHMQKIGSFRSINPYNPFLGMWVTLTRTPRWMEGKLHPEQIITREQAIRLYTINNAHLVFQEKEKGSLEAGKLADFIVLDRDILTCPVGQVRDIKVEQTYLGGKRLN